MQRQNVSHCCSSGVDAAKMPHISERAITRSVKAPPAVRAASGPRSALPTQVPYHGGLEAGWLARLCHYTPRYQEVPLVVARRRYQEAECKLPYEKKSCRFHMFHSLLSCHTCTRHRSLHGTPNPRSAAGATTHCAGFLAPPSESKSALSIPCTTAIMCTALAAIQLH
jgi:hypothetical protein